MGEMNTKNVLCQSERVKLIQQGHTRMIREEQNETEIDLQQLTAAIFDLLTTCGTIIINQ